MPQHTVLSQDGIVPVLIESMESSCAADASLM